MVYFAIRNFGPRWRCVLLFGAAFLSGATAGHAAQVGAIEPHHAVYLEALGKGGLWGVGYDRLLADRAALGITGSLYFLDGQRIATLSPYFTHYFRGETRGRWMLQAGPQLIQQSTATAQIPEWSGTSSTRLQAQLGVGWEHRSSTLLRLYGMVAAGNKGVAPWMGASVGWVF